MANTRISNLTASASNLAATDVTPVVQTTGVGPVKMTGLQIAGGLLGSTALTGATITTSQPVLNLSQTWNASGVTFTGLRFNATDTASASGSLLLDLQIGGVSQFNVSKDGNVSAGTSSVQAAITAGYFITRNLANVGVYIRSNDSSAGIRFGTADDLILRRAAAATLQLGAADAAAPVAQTLQVQSVVAGTSNTAGTNFTIKGSQGTGTGAGGSIIFQVAPEGSTGSAQNAYSTALTIRSDRTLAIGGSPSSIIRGSNNYLEFANLSNASFLFYGTGYASGNDAFSLDPVLSAVNVRSGGFFGWSNNASSANAGADVRLYRDAANTLALRNGGTSGSPVPQTFNVYNYYASSTDFERCAIKWSGNNFTIGLESNGGFTSRELIIVAGSGQALRFYAGGTQRWLIDQSGNLITGAASYDIGAATSNRPGNIYAATSIRATGSTAVIGYGTGAGGAVTQATSRTTGVTLDKGCGQITLVSAAGSATWQSFTVTNSTVATTDTIIVNQDSGADLYQIFVTNVAAGSFQITFATTGGTTTEQPVFSFAVIKAVAA